MLNVRRRTTLFIFALSLFAAVAYAQTTPRILYEAKSEFQRITVRDINGYRQLIFDGKFDGTDSIQSEMNLAAPTELTLSYARHMITALPLLSNTKSPHILVVGLGGACIQRYLHKLLPDATIESAELDPAVLDVAQKFFDYKPDDHQKVHIGDGRKFIEQSKDKYDLIMLDAFSATSIPYLLATKEFLTACRDHLADGGLVCSNLWYEVPDYHDMVKTYASVFPEVQLLRCVGSTNNILMALPVRRNITGNAWIAAAKTFEKAHPTGAALNLPDLVDRALESVPRIPASAKILLDQDEALHELKTTVRTP